MSYRDCCKGSASAVRVDREKRRGAVVGCFPLHRPRSIGGGLCEMSSQEGMSSKAPLSLLESLPVEILLQIVACAPPIDLIRLSRVSRACRAIARSESVWRDIVLSAMAQRGSAPEHGGSRGRWRGVVEARAVPAASRSAPGLLLVYHSVHVSTGRLLALADLAD